MEVMVLFERTIKCLSWLRRDIFLLKFMHFLFHFYFIAILSYSFNQLTLLMFVYAYISKHASTSGCRFFFMSMSK